MNNLTSDNSETDLLNAHDDMLQANDSRTLGIQLTKEDIDKSQDPFVANPTAGNTEIEPLSPNIFKPKDIYERQYEAEKADISHQGTPFLKPELIERYGAIEGLVKGSAAALARESFVASALTYGFNASQRRWMGTWTDPNFDPISDKYIDNYQTVNEKFWPSLVNTGNEHEFYARLEQLQFEDSMNKVADRARWWQQLPGYAGAFALDLYATGGTGNLKMGVEAAKKIVNANLRTVLSTTAAKPLVLETAREMLLHTNQETRTIGESIANVGIVGTLGAGAGVYGKYVDAKHLDQLKELLGNVFDGKKVTFAANEKGKAIGFNVSDDTAGAASTKFYDFKDLSIYGTGENGEFSWLLTPFLKATGKVLGNPVIKGMMSKSVTMRRLTAGLLENNLDIGGDFVGKARPDPLQHKIARDIIRDTVDVDLRTAEAYFDYLGIDIDATNPLVTKAQSYFKDKEYLKLPAFRHEITKAFRAGGVHENAVIAKTAKGFIDDISDPITKRLIEQGHLKDGTNPYGTEIQYLMRVYNQDYLSQNFNKAKGQLTDAYEDIQNKIIEAKKPLDDVFKLLEAAKKAYDKASPLAKEEAYKQVNAAERKYKRLEKQFKQDMRDGKFDEALLVGEKGFTTKELKQYNALKKESNKLKRNIANLEDELKVSVRKQNVGRKPGEKNKELTESDIKLKEQIKEAKEALKEFRNKLKEGAEAGTYNRNIVRKGFNENYYLNKKNIGSLAFRKIVEKEELTIAAESTLNKILGLTPDQMSEELAGLAKAGGGANFLENRSLLLSDKLLDEMGFLETDIRKIMDAYVTSAHRLINKTDFLIEQGWKGKEAPEKFIAHGLDTDYSNIRVNLDSKYEKLLENATGDKKKAIQKKYMQEQDDLTKSLNHDKEAITEIWNRITGAAPVQHRGLTRLFRFANKYMNTRSLNSLILLMLQDLVTPAFRVGWKNQVMSGLLPYIGNALIPGNKANAAFRREARNMALATETTMALYGKSFDVASGDTLPKSFRLLGLDIPAEKYMDVMARIQTVWNLNSPMADMTMTMATMSTQASILDALRLASKGKLGPKGLRFLAQSGLDPESKISKSILAQMDKHKQRLSGGTLANVQLWEDPKAVKAFSAAIYRNVKGAIFGGPNPATWPIYLGDPRGRSSSLFKFMGYGLTAINNYLIPTLQGVQRGEVERLSVMMMMVMISSSVEPLRAIGAGRKPDLDPNRLLIGGITNSGIFGTYLDLYNRANYIADIFPHSKADRFKYTRGLLNSAPEAVFQQIAETGGMLVNADLNKKDITNVINSTLFPANAYHFKPVTRKFVESLNLPEKRTVTAAE